MAVLRSWGARVRSRRDCHPGQRKYWAQYPLASDAALISSAKSAVLLLVISMPGKAEFFERLEFLHQGVARGHGFTEENILMVIN